MVQPTTARGRATRARILAAAPRVFVERGYDATRMGDLASAAGVAHGTVYTYFDTKGDVLLAALDAAVADLAAATVVPTVRDPRLRIESAVRSYVQAHRQHHHVLVAAEQAAASDPRVGEVLVDLRRTHAGRVALSIRMLQADGLASPDVDPPTAAAALCAMLEGFATHWLTVDESQDVSSAVGTLALLWAGALRVPDRPASAGPRGTEGPHRR